MYTFKDPSEFSTTIPPVPDVKAWLNEFRTKHPCTNTMNDEYKQQISSLNAKNEEIRMEFETMQISNQNITNNQLKLQNELNDSHKQIKQLLHENKELKQQNEAQNQQIIALKQQIIELQQQNTQNTLITNTNPTIQTEIKWNFDCANTNVTNTKTAIISSSNQAISNNRINRKRPRSQTNSNDDDESSDLSKKAKLSPFEQQTTSSTTINENGILDKKLPTNLDLIRGDILAEAGSEEQIYFCFNMLKKCSTEEWQLRHFLMEMITGLCEEAQSMQTALIYECRHIIKKQLTDLRSAIVKTACEMMISFSLYCTEKSKFAQCLAFLIPIHLQGLYVTIAVIRDAHNQCLTECIKNTRSLKCISPLLKGLTNKHSEVRVKVIGLMSSILTACSDGENGQVSNSKLTKYQDQIGNTIIKYIGDKNANVRNAVKELFENFATLFPQKAKILLAKMDVGAQKTLRKSVGQSGVRTQYKSNYGQSTYSRTLRK